MITKKRIRDAISGAVVLPLALALASAAPATAERGTRAEIRSDFVRVLAWGNEMLEAQSDFNAARAAGDRDEMEAAAFDLLGAATAAAFWTAMLDITMTPENATPEADAKAAELRTLAANVLQRLVPIVLTGDFDALAARLDDSAESLNAFQRLTVGIADLPWLLDLR